jgi:hypothetical protein
VGVFDKKANDATKTIFIGCCPSDMNKNYFKFKFLPQILKADLEAKFPVPDLTEKISNISIHLQPESILCERVTCIVF